MQHKHKHPVWCAVHLFRSRVHFMTIENKQPFFIGYSLQWTVISRELSAVPHFIHLHVQFFSTMNALYDPKCIEEKEEMEFLVCVSFFCVSFILWNKANGKEKEKKLNNLALEMKNKASNVHTPSCGLQLEIQFK